MFDLDASGQEGERTLTFHLSARSSFQELAVRAAADDERWWSVSGRPIYDEFGNFVGYRGSGTDLTEKKRTQERASRLAHYDSLTGLANRFQMSQSLEKVLNAPMEMQRCYSISGIAASMAERTSCASGDAICRTCSSYRIHCARTPG